MEKEKNNVGLYIIIVILCIGLTIAVCYILFNKGNNTKSIDNQGQQINNNSDNNINNIENINDNKNKSIELINDIEAISIDSQIVNTARKIFDNIYISESNLYSNNRYDISNISNYELIATALKNIDSNYILGACSESTRKVVSFDTLNLTLNEYILNKSINLNTIKSLTNKSSYPDAQYEVDNIGIIINSNGISLIGPCDGALGPQDYIDKKILSAEKNNDYLYIYEKQVFVSYNDNLSVNYYKDYNRTSVVEKNLKEDTIPNWNLYNTYKYTFKLINNNYYFESFELVN